MISLILAAQLVATDPAVAVTFFSPTALSAPVTRCGRPAKQPAISAFEASWFSAVWIRADEPSLAKAAASPLSIWRFTEIPTWRQPMIFRISEEADGSLRMVAKRLSGKGGYDPGKLQDQKDRLLSPDEQRRFQQALQSTEDVWADPLDCAIILDGNELLLERTQAGQYIIGQRYWQEGQPMAAMSSLLSGFAGWDH